MLRSDIETYLNDADTNIIPISTDNRIHEEIFQYLLDTQHVQLVNILRDVLNRVEERYAVFSVVLHQYKWYIFLRSQYLLPDTVCDLSIGYQEISAHYSRIRWLPLETCQEFCSIRRRLEVPEYPDDWGGHVFVWATSLDNIELYSLDDNDLTVQYTY